MPNVPEINQLIAARLREAAELLAQQRANPFRVGAYRNAAATVAGLSRDLGELVEAEGTEGLVALPNIGWGLGRAITEMVRTGGWAQLERLRGALDPEKLFQTIPGIGPELARRIYEQLHVESLEALEVAAHDGRLERVPGVGRRRAASIRATLDHTLGRRLSPRPAAMHHGPDVAALLDVDREYREKAEAGELATLAPRRFNPEGEAWLPVLHCQRGDWHFTARFSNTARAHELSRTRDWVVIYFYDDHHQEGQHTVVTETRGMLQGYRVVRGREHECRGYYAALWTRAG